MWAPDSDGVFVYNSASGRTERLSLREGIVWDLACRYDDDETVIAMLGHILDLTGDAAATYLRDCRCRWHEEGFLG